MNIMIDLVLSPAGKGVSNAISKLCDLHSKNTLILDREGISYTLMSNHNSTCDIFTHYSFDIDDLLSIIEKINLSDRYTECILFKISYMDLLLKFDNRLLCKLKESEKKWVIFAQTPKDGGFLTYHPVEYGYLHERIVLSFFENIMDWDEDKLQHRKLYTLKKEVEKYESIFKS